MSEVALPTAAQAAAIVATQLRAVVVPSGADGIGVRNTSGRYSEPSLQGVLDEDCVVKVDLAAIDGTGGTSLIRSQNSGAYFGGIHGLESILQFIGAALAGGFQTIANPSAFTLSAGHTLAAALADAVTNSAPVIENLTHATSGTAAAGFGLTQKRQLHNAAGTMKDASAIITKWTNAGAGTEAAEVDIQASVAGSLANVATLTGTLAAFPGNITSNSSSVVTALQLADNTDPGFGASMVGLQDVGGYFGGPNTFVEAALQIAGLHISQCQTIANPSTFTLSTGNVLTVALSDAATNAVSIIETDTHATSGTAAVGFGSSVKQRLQNAAGTMKDASAIITKWTNATAGSEASEVDIQGVTAGGALTNVAQLTPAAATFPGTVSGTNITTDEANIASISANLVAPYAPQLMLFMYDGQNLNGSNNVGLTDGSAVGSTLNNTAPTVPGGISLASAANLLQATGAAQPIFRKTGGPHGLSCIELDGARFMKTAAFTSQPIPFTVAIVWLNTDTTNAYIFYSGADTNDAPQFATNVGGSQYATYDGNNLARVVTIGTARWNVAITEYNNTSSFDMFNGGDWPVGTTGNQSMSGFCIGEQGSDGTEKAKGKIALIACWSGTDRAISRVGINYWISQKLGILPV